MTEPGKFDGRLILNCNRTVFCLRVVSLGKHPPAEGYCQARVGVRIDSGRAGKTAQWQLDEERRPFIGAASLSEQPFGTILPPETPCTYS